MPRGIKKVISKVYDARPKMHQTTNTLRAEEWLARKLVDLVESVAKKQKAIVEFSANLVNPERDTLQTFAWTRDTVMSAAQMRAAQDIIARVHNMRKFRDEDGYAGPSDLQIIYAIRETLHEEVTRGARYAYNQSTSISSNMVDMHKLSALAEVYEDFDRFLKFYIEEDRLSW